MRNNIILFSALVLLCGGVLGCDKFKPAVKSKPEVKIEVQPAVVEAKGPVVAKVNNISIGLDDLNAEITVYNANVPEDRSELKITTKEQKVNYLIIDSNLCRRFFLVILLWEKLGER